MKKLGVTFFFLFLFFIGNAQDKIVYGNKVYKENIKSISLHPVGVKYGIPILEFKTSNQLVLEFDDLNETGTDYSYTVIHCDQEGFPSNLNPIEYIKGFESGELSDFQNSFNTLIPYTHYELYFPNEQMDILLSGHYILYIYEGSDREKPVITRNFYVVDNALEIQTKFIRSSLVSEMDESQEAEISINDKRNMVLNPSEDMTIAIFQNVSDECILKCKAPDFIKGNVYEYKNSRAYSVKAGNEYRYFNTKNLKYVNEKINAVYFEAPYYIFELNAEGSNTLLPYSYSGDINGHFLIVSDHNENPSLEAEYVLVDFTYLSEYLPSVSLYISGSFTGTQYSDYFKADYNYNKKAYTKRLLLKQGFYNYAYVLYDHESKTYSLSETEGNHYETENDYLILVYYKPHGAQYEQIIGYKIVNTFKNL